MKLALLSLVFALVASLIIWPVVFLIHEVRLMVHRQWKAALGSILLLIPFGVGALVLVRLAPAGHAGESSAAQQDAILAISLGCHLLAWTGLVIVIVRASRRIRERSGSVHGGSC